MLFKRCGFPVVIAVLFVFSTLVFQSENLKATTSWSEEYDAAQGTLHNVVTENAEANYFGEGYVAGWNGDGQAVDIQVNVPRDDKYTLVFNYSGAAGSATRYLEVDGEMVVDQVRFSGTGSWADWQTTYVKDVFLTAGENTITLGFDSTTGSRNWLNYDSLLVKEASSEDVVEWGLKEEADRAQQSTYENFWNDNSHMFNNQYPHNENNDQFHYWWQAHGIDILIDRYERSGDETYLDQAGILYEGIKTRNGGDIRNDFYDDMLWMALALQRLHLHTDNPEYEQAVHTLWEDIKTGWSDEYGGGIAWNKFQLDYKNTPSNAPAVILAARLYEQYGNQEDLEWAKKIYNWHKNTLVDPTNGLVWDGINRTGDGNIDKSWEFTYNQGVYIGASVKLFEITGDQQYLDAAIQTAETTKERFTNHNGIIYEGGTGDGGLFKGILTRYVAELVKTDQSQIELAEWIVTNAQSVWNQTKTEPEILFGGTWEGTLSKPVELSQQLSGVMLMEHAVTLEPVIFESVYKELATQVDTLQTDGDLKKSVAKKLSNRVRQVEHHYNKGNDKQALKHLAEFEKHLQKGKEKGHVTELAYEKLQLLVDKILN
ncbi:glycoside hydrolase family 76 protein [Gracilibacillus kekensis]|uniref:Predicted alpha-1,6-mannanase, GH76 family n=1 Tax=Gracilibacillus kekensis TaxID=1027249 RepID=A0A1M7LD60_9BACI|nr:glycoside hydrolase family 76 protein [Gracilibacillus kekensis]SHM75544.1 Predicted alpha-1,6-mannanase, GH76 family [Gracilibacillus kekensis]